jgi:outer membrane lipoprotein SlyB
VTRILLLLGGVAIALSACANETPQQKHEVGCFAGTMTGGVLGGLAGSLIGGGTGRALAAAAGAAAGTIAGEKLACSR